MDNFEFEIIDGNNIPFGQDVFTNTDPQPLESDKPSIRVEDLPEENGVLPKSKSPKKLQEITESQMKNAFLGKEDEEDKEDDEEVQDEKKEDKEDKQEVDSDLKVFFNNFVKMGIVDDNPDYDGSEEGLIEAFNNRDSKVKEVLYTQIAEELGEEGTALIKHLRNGGEVADFVDAYSDPLAGIDITSPAHQKEIVRHFYKSQGWNDSEIASEIEDLEDLGEEKLAEKARKMYSRLEQNREQTKAQFAEEAAKEEQRQLRQRDEFVTDVNKILDEKTDIFGYSLPKDPKVKQELKDYMLKPRFRTQDGRVVPQIVVDREKFKNNREAYILNALLLKNGYNLDSLKTQANTKVTLDIKKQLENSRKQVTIPKKVNEESNSRSSNKSPELDWSKLFGQ